MFIMARTSFSIRTVPFIGALVVSYIYVENAVLSTLMDYLLYSSGEDNLRIAAIAKNLQDGLSSFLFLFVSPISEVYTGCFTMITFCTAALIQGLMLLWTSTSTSELNAVYAAIFFLALGSCNEKLLDKFLEYQLQENIKTRKLREPKHGSTQSKKKQDLTDRLLTTCWSSTPLIVGYIVTVCINFTANSETSEHQFRFHQFRFSALLMGATYLLFLFGSVWYKHEELAVESNLHKIYRICKAALGKWKLKYPTSPSCYYKNDCKKNDLYESKHEKRLRIRPRVPRLYKWLDKAAIVEEEYSSDHNVSFLKKQEENNQLCTVKDVSEVKGLVPMLYLCFAFFAYSLLLATGNTFFVAQASSMTPVLTTNGNDISVLFLIKDGGQYLSRFICFLISIAFLRFRAFRAFIKYLTCNNKKATIIRIGFGMICAVICSLIAWQVELSRLQVPKEVVNNPNNSTMALIPQFSLLGMTEGLVDGGFTSLFYWHVAKSMQSFGDSFSGFVIGSGKLFIVPLVLIFRSWFGETVDNSHLDKFYLMLGILNAAFFLVFAYYSFKYAYKEECSKDDEPDTEEVEFNDESSTIEGSTEALENFIPENNIEIQSGNQDLAEDNEDNHGELTCEIYKHQI